MQEENAQYRRSVRNTLLVVGAMLTTIVVAILVPPLVAPVHEQLNGSASVSSPYGFTLSVQLNATLLASGQAVSITAWLNSSSGQIGNISAANRWPLPTQGLWTRICTSGWPLGVGMMAGYYTTDNYSLGPLLPSPRPLAGCPVSTYIPTFFLLQPHGSVAIVEVNGTFVQWDLTTKLGLRPSNLGPQHGGVYTAIGADEWGDVAIAHLRVS